MLNLYNVNERWAIRMWNRRRGFIDKEKQPFDLSFAENICLCGKFFFALLTRAIPSIPVSFVV